jgi:molecular chaperone DnaJ
VVSSDEKTMLEKMNHSSNFKPNPDKNQKSFFEKMREMFG